MSYQRLWKWYLIPPCLTLSNIRYVSRVKWSNPGPTPRCCWYQKGSLLVANCIFFIFFFYSERKNLEDVFGFIWKSEIASPPPINHHHHVVPPARISLTLSHHFSLSFIASGRSSGLHPISSHSCCMYVRAGRPAFAQPYVGVHRSTSRMSSSLLLQQCPACLVHLTWIVFMMGGRWPYSWCLVGCCRQVLFNIAHSFD